MSESNFSPETPGKEINTPSILEHKKMYEISGQNEIVDYSLQRYLRNKARFSKDLSNFINPEQKNQVDVDSPEYFKEKMKSAPENEKLNIGEKIFDNIISSFETGDVESQQKWAELIPYVPYDENKSQLINLGLNSNNIETQIACVNGVYSVGDETEKSELGDKIFNLVSEKFNGNDFQTQITWANNLYGISYEQECKLEKSIVKLINEAFQSDNIQAQITWTKNLDHVVSISKDMREELEMKIPQMVVKGIKSEKKEDRIAWAKNISLVPKEEERKEIFKLAKMQKDLCKYLIEPPLYKDKSISKENFSRTGFGRTESETTLVGGNLKNKTIIRHMEIEAFQAWQKMYEDYELWERSGFDYVPIEPIQSFRLNKNGLVDVFCGVLDLNLKSWESMSDDFIDELYTDLDKISEVFEEKKIKHGDIHWENTCLRFIRDEHGDIDFSKKPRIYLIDFEKTTLSSPF